MKKSLLIFLCPFFLSCEPKEEPKPPAFHLGGVKVSSSKDAISKLAYNLVDRIGELEKEKDVVCWTSFRQLDQFIATKEYSEAATLTKVEVQKAAVRAIWSMASSDKDSISAADIEGVIGKLEEQTQDSEFTKNLTDYRTTSDHWRVILAVLMDDLAASGVPKVLDKGAVDALGEFVLRYSILLLKESGRRATRYRNPYIEPSNIIEASDFLAKKYKLKKVKKPRSKRKGARFADLLFSLTEKLMSKKIDALKYFNANDPRAKVKPESTFAAINAISPLPLEQDAFQELFDDVKSFAAFASSGHMPMRNDNYLTGRFAAKSIRGYDFVDAIRMERITRQIFPHQVKANGDVQLRFEPNPGIVTKIKRESRDFLMLDHQQNAVRDSALHWQVLALVFMDKKFSLDPFAAEILSETISMMFTYFVFDAARIAKEAGRKTITVSDAKKVRDGSYAQVRRKAEMVKDWTDEAEEAKQKVLSKARISFADSSQQSGFAKLGIVANPGTKYSPKSFSGIQTVMGSGMASGDVDNDGDLDLFVAGIEKNILYLNDGNGNFQNANEDWAVPKELKHTKDVLFTDWNGDGKLDLFIIRSLLPSLLLEQRDGKFIDVTAESGFKTDVGSHVMHAFDFDNDGDLDIYVGYYGADTFNSGKNRKENLPSVDGRNGTANQLWEYNDGKYTEVGARLGVDDPGWAMAIVAWDFDHDGDRDIYIANDFGPNVFLQKEGDKYIDISRSSGTADRGSGMNVSLTDVNNDGFFDFYITNIDMFVKSLKTIFPTDSTTIQIDPDLLEFFQYINGNRFYVSQKPEKGKKVSFKSEEKKRVEPMEHGWAWATNFFDADNDGDEDMYLANGWIEGSTASRQANQFFVAHDGFFYRAKKKEAKNGKRALQFEDNSRSVLAQDFDGDGKVDLVVNNFRGSVVFFKNTSKSKGNWARFSLRGQGKNTYAIGSVITVKAGKRTMKRALVGGDGYLSQHAELHFGLGKAKKISYEVKWPNGKVTKGESLAGKLISVNQPSD